MKKKFNDELNPHEKYSSNTERSKSSIEKLREKYKEMRKEAKLDTKSFDPDFMDMNTDLAISGIKSKWLNYKYDYLIKLNQLEEYRNQIRRDLFEFYKSKDNGLDIKLETKEELHLFIDSDKSYKNQLSLCGLVNIIIEYCNSVIKILEQKSWEIKNYIDFKKYTLGVDN